MATPTKNADEAADEAADGARPSSWYAYVLVSFGAPRIAASPTMKSTKAMKSAKPVKAAAPARQRRLALPRDPQKLAAKVVRTYVGVAIDVERRARQHNGEIPGGARSTRVGRPWRVAVVHGPFPDRGSAQAVEYQLKQRRGAAARLKPL